MYWVVTSDALAEDSEIYPQLGAEKLVNRETGNVFLTDASAKAMQGFRGLPRPRSSDAEEVYAQGAEFQQQQLAQVDFNKVVLSFNNTHALGPTDAIPSQLQSVADSRAAVPHSQDVDLESTLRLTSDHAFFTPLSLGTLTSFVYERSIKGNLSGSPESISYPQNNLTLGGFVQIRLQRHMDTPSRALPRELIVLTPHQYQTQINNPRLFIPYTAKDPNNPGQTLTGQLAVILPKISSFSDKVGFRHEWGVRPDKTWWKLDSGSYAEGGFEYSVQNEVLRAVSLTNFGGTQAFRCPATARVDIVSCFKGAKNTFPIGPTTGLSGPPEALTLHTPGGYWDAHLSRAFTTGTGKEKKTWFTLVSDSQGDAFAGRPSNVELPTQTRFAVVWNSSVNFPVWGNLSVGPTYNAFFYRPQLSNLYEQLRTFSIALRWYTARDERVPLWRQLLLAGPASADQTKSSGKSK